MKGKRTLSLLLALCMIAALAITNLVVASAAEGDRFVGTVYSVEDLLAANGVEKLDGEEKYSDGRIVRYRYTANEDGEPVDEGQAQIEDADEEVTFHEVGTYTFYVYLIADPETLETQFTVNTKAEQVKEYTRIWSHSYTLDGLLTYLGMTKLESENASATVSTGRTVRYRIDEDDRLESEWKVSGANIEFKSVGYYTVEVYVGEKITDFSEKNPEKTFRIRVTENVNADPEDADYNKTSVTYLFEELDLYRAKVRENAADLITGESFNVPTLEDYVYSKDFDYEDLQKEVFFCEPDSTTYVSGSTVTSGTASFTVDYVGTYSYYVLFTDVYGNTMTTENLVLGEGGWYKKDADGNKTGGVVIPVFSFRVEETSAPKITVKASNNAYLGLSYKIDCFNIISENAKKQYRLYFSADQKIDKDEYSTDDEYRQAVLAATTDITEDANYVDNGYIDLDSLTFTPQEKGYYYVQVRVVDNYLNEDTVMSRPISCMEEKKAIVRETEFFKNNVVSFVFLGIAGLCLIAILVLLFVKPKKTEQVEVVGDEQQNENNKK